MAGGRLDTLNAVTGTFSFTVDLIVTVNRAWGTLSELRAFDQTTGYLAVTVSLGLARIELRCQSMGYSIGDDGSFARCQERQPTELDPRLRNDSARRILSDTVKIVDGLLKDITEKLQACAVNDQAPRRSREDEESRVRGANEDDESRILEKVIKRLRDPGHYVYTADKIKYAIKGTTRGLQASVDELRRRNDALDMFITTQRTEMLADTPSRLVQLGNDIAKLLVLCEDRSHSRTSMAAANALLAIANTDLTQHFDNAELDLDNFGGTVNLGGRRQIICYEGQPCLVEWLGKCKATREQIHHRLGNLAYRLQSHDPEIFRVPIVEGFVELPENAGYGLVYKLPMRSPGKTPRVISL